jgi:hypothetical protein
MENRTRIATVIAPAMLVAANSEATTARELSNEAMTAETTAIAALPFERCGADGCC